MRRTVAALSLLFVAASHKPPTSGAYLFVWAGDSANTASDFLAVIDADPTSRKYGHTVVSLPTGEAGTHPHHTEAVMPADNHLLANGFHAGRTWLFDLSVPTAPKIMTAFGDRAGFSNPHTYVRLDDGRVLATFQYKADSSAAAPSHDHGAAHAAAGPAHTTGGLVEMDERGTVVRSASAADTTIPDRWIFPYSVLPIATLDRAVSTSTDMDHADTVATSQWVQLWRLSDLTLLKTIALPPGPRGDEQNLTGEPHLLPDGKSVYIHTFSCGLYLVRDIAGTNPTAKFITNFPGKECGVPILTSHYWLQPVPDAHALIALDITDPEHPVQTSSVNVGADEEPHWASIDGTGRRIVMNSAGYGGGNRLFIINFDPATGKLVVDETFRDSGSTHAGVSMRGKTWPHGFIGTAIPHGSVFSR